MKKKISKPALMFLVLAIILVAVFLGYILLQQGYKPFSSSGYYEELMQKCKENYPESPGCCMSSVENMAEGNYTLASGETLAESGCPEGLRANTLKCIGSYVWCEPEPVIGCATDEDCPENYSCECTGIIPLCPLCEGGECVYTCVLCAKEGETIGARGMPGVCCSGLKSIGGWPGGYDGDCSVPAPPTGLQICANCGNEICDANNGENKCNCPEDCK